MQLNGHAFLSSCPAVGFVCIESCPIRIQVEIVDLVYALV